MSTYTLPHFGELDLAALDEYYDVDIEFAGHEVQIDLNFEGSKITAKRMDVVKKFIENLPELNAKNIKAIKDDFTNGDTVEEYIEHHLEDTTEEELAGIVDFSNTSISAKEQMLAKIHLVRVGLYPDSEDQFAIFDYTISREVTQYLIVLNTDEKGKLDYMTMES